MSERQPRNAEAGAAGRGPGGPRPGGPIGGQPGGPHSGGPIGGQPGGPGGSKPDSAAGAPTNLLTGARLRIVAGLGIGLFVVVLGLVAYFAWINIAYVDTFHARIDATLVQVRAPAMGRIAQLPLEVGDAVEQHEDLAMLEAAGAAGTSPVARMLVPVKAPIAGVVTAKAVKVGDIVQPGQVMVTLVDPDQLWVTANLHESRIPQVRVGQRARIVINTRTVRRIFWGRVEQIGRATNIALAAGQGADTSAPRAAEVPVRISLENAGYELYPGMSAEVRIQLNPR